MSLFSLVVPIYRNEASLPALLAAIGDLNRALGGQLEAVLVVDGSPDRSYDVLRRELPKLEFRSQLLALSRNFGAFRAIKAGLANGRGEFFGVMAADLQEPPDLILLFHKMLVSGEYDVVVGTREGRDDPPISRLLSRLFWAGYRACVQREMPAGGVDVFGCTRSFRDRLLELDESNSTLVGLLFWLGFRRGEVRYRRKAREHGRSAWTFARKFRYVLDSTFAFSDLPIRTLSLVGVLGILASLGMGLAVVITKALGLIPIPGYAATAVLVVFFGGLNALGLGLIGEYVWRIFENTKRRPSYLVADRRDFPGEETK